MEQTQKPVYVHYGHSDFAPEQIGGASFNGRGTCLINKPVHALYASLENDPYGWKNWLLEEAGGGGFHLESLDKAIYFTLDDSAKILVIDSEEVAEQLPRVSRSPMFRNCMAIDFDHLAQFYDVIDVRCISQGLPYGFSGYDADQIMVFNPDVVIPIEGREPENMNEILHQYFFEHNSTHKWGSVSAAFENDITVTCYPGTARGTYRMELCDRSDWSWEKTEQNYLEVGDLSERQFTDLAAAVMNFDYETMHMKKLQPIIDAVLHPKDPSQKEHILNELGR